MSNDKKQADRSIRRSSKDKFAVQGFYTPFEQLDQHLEQHERAKKKRKRQEKRPSRPPHLLHFPPPEVRDQHLVPIDREREEKEFLEAMADVAPLGPSDRERVPVSSPTKKPPRFLSQEEMEVYAHLVDLVTGEGPFELSYSDEYVEGVVVGLSPEILKKLRGGDFSYQDYVDLHGYNREQARHIVTRFIRQSFAGGHRCVLIVSGRGLNSKEGRPVLKENLTTWLTRAPLKSLVLAFASARSYDGGVGAFYVILRRNEGKASFVSPAV